MIKRLLRRLINWAEYSDLYPTLAVQNHDPGFDMPSPIRFKIQPATGGTIVEIIHYDRKREEETVNLHIISDSESDMTQAIARIVTIELLKA
jgi:hypothetical protein